MANITRTPDEALQKISDDKTLSDERNGVASSKTETSLKRIEADIDSISASIATLTCDVVSLKASLATLTSDLASIRASLATMTSDVKIFKHNFGLYRREVMLGIDSLATENDTTTQVTQQPALFGEKLSVIRATLSAIHDLMESLIKNRCTINPAANTGTEANTQNNSTTT